MLREQIPFEETQLYTWFERDRAHVELRHERTEETIVEWWDEAVGEAIEDGFLPSSPSQMHEAAYDYADERGMAVYMPGPVRRLPR